VGRALLPMDKPTFSVLGAPASIMGRSFQSTWLRPFVVNRNICNFLWYGGVEGGAGEGLRSVGMPIPNQELVLYPAHRSPFIGPGRSSSGPSHSPARCPKPSSVPVFGVRGHN
jgi:hypothetical protein